MNNKSEKLLRDHKFWLLAGLCLLLFLSGNWLLPLIDRDEPRFAEASREMLERHDWIIPWFNGNYRFDKPPLIYWCQIAAYRLLGENEFAARFPSTLFATGTALLLYALGRRTTNSRTGIWSALIFATCLQTLVHSQLAVADMAMVFFVTLAVCSGWEMVSNNAHSKRWWWLFYLSLGLGFLAKGPVAWLPILGVIWLARSKASPAKVSSIMRSLRLPAGLSITIGLVALWGIPALIQTHGEFFHVGIGKHVISRMFSPMEGHGSKGRVGYLLTLPFFFVTFFASFFPWSLYSIIPLSNVWRNRGQDTLNDYLILQALLFFIVFTLSKTKLPHYTLPAFPCLALWLARIWSQNNNPPHGFKRWVIALTTFMLITTLGVFPYLKPCFASASLYEKARPHLKPDMAFLTLDYEEPSVIWEFRESLTNHLVHLSSTTALSDVMKTNASFVVIGETKSFTNGWENLLTNKTKISVSGLNMAKGKPVDLTAIIVKPAEHSKQ